MYTSECDNINKIPYRYDIVGSFLRSERLKHARENFNNNLISKNELKKIENEEILKLVKKEEAAGLKAVSDGISSELLAS